jgi:hypothetical protein
MEPSQSVHFPPIAERNWSRPRALGLVVDDMIQHKMMFHSQRPIVTSEFQFPVYDCGPIGAEKQTILNIPFNVMLSMQ